jgi:hypothetical protein
MHNPEQVLDAISELECTMLLALEYSQAHLLLTAP